MQQCIGTLDYRALFLQMGPCFVLFFGFVHAHDELCIHILAASFTLLDFGLDYWIKKMDVHKSRFKIFKLISLKSFMRKDFC